MKYYMDFRRNDFAAMHGDGSILSSEICLTLLERQSALAVEYVEGQGYEGKGPMLKRIMDVSDVRFMIDGEMAASLAAKLFRTALVLGWMPPKDVNAWIGLACKTSAPDPERKDADAAAHGKPDCV